LVEYIFPSNKEWTGVWFLRYRDLHLPFTTIGKEIINNVVLVDKIYTIIAKSVNRRKTYKSATSNEQILGIRKETQARMLSLPIIDISKNRETYVV